MRILYYYFFLGFLLLAGSTAFSQSSVLTYGGDIKSTGFLTYITIGEPIASFTLPNPFVQEGFLAVLFENNQILGIISSSDQEIQFFPNPFFDEIEIRLKSNSFSSIEAQIFNLNGESVKEFQIKDNETKESLGNLKNGTYLIRFHRSNLKDVIYKIIKL